MELVGQKFSVGSSRLSSLQPLLKEGAKGAKIQQVNCNDLNEALSLG
jgi:hypothetical protein